MSMIYTDWATVMGCDIRTWVEVALDGMGGQWDVDAIIADYLVLVNALLPDGISLQEDQRFRAYRSVNAPRGSVLRALIDRVDFASVVAAHPAEK